MECEGTDVVATGQERRYRRPQGLRQAVERAQRDRLLAGLDALEELVVDARARRRRILRPAERLARRADAPAELAQEQIELHSRRPPDHSPARGDTAETSGAAGSGRRAVSRDATRQFLVVTGALPEMERLSRLLGSSLGLAEPELVRAADPVQARAAADDQRFDAVFVDVDGLPPGTIHELEALVGREGFPPILAFTSCSDPEFAARLLELGIDDCLVKGDVDGAGVGRAVVLGAARSRLRARLYAESLTDELTGLYNRRGFLRIGGQFLDGAKRRGCGAWLLFADVRGLKRINDRFGHVAGDRTLRAAADLLRSSFRSADVVARLGGDEFTVLAGDASESSRELLVARALGRLDGARRSAGLDVAFGLAIGAARFRPAEPIPLQELLRIAGEEAAAAKRRERCEG